MSAHLIEGIILGLILITGFIISQVIQHRRRKNRP